MTTPLSLVAAGNTYNPCLLVLRKNGYELWAEDDDDRTLWNASKGNCSFMGYTPPELLGIVTLWEHFGEEWNVQHPDVLDEITEKMSGTE